MAKEGLRFGTASCAQGVVLLRPVRCEDFAMSLAGQPSHILAEFLSLLMWRSTSGYCPEWIFRTFLARSLINLRTLDIRRIPL